MRILRADSKVFSMQIAKVLGKSEVNLVVNASLRPYNGHFKGEIWSMYKQIGQSLDEITENDDF